MRILITGAFGNVGKGIAPRLIAAGHDVVLTDLQAPDGVDQPFVAVDLRTGEGLNQAAEGCDLILHCAAWHGIHWNQKTEIDYWQLNIDGTFWALQAAQANGIKRVVFLSSQAWHGHYDKYGFTKRIGEELCEYNRRHNGIGYVATRPLDFTPWGNDWVNRYGARLLYGGVDREDVMHSIEASIATLANWTEGEAPGIAIDAVRPNAFMEAQIADWEADPRAACEAIFPGYLDLIDRYGISIARKPGLIQQLGWSEVGYQPKHHFGAFLEELRLADANEGEAAVRARVCPY